MARFLVPELVSRTLFLLDDKVMLARCMRVNSLFYETAGSLLYQYMLLDQSTGARIQGVWSGAQDRNLGRSFARNEASDFRARLGMWARHLELDIVNGYHMDDSCLDYLPFKNLRTISWTVTEGKAKNSAAFLPRLMRDNPVERICAFLDTYSRDNLYLFDHLPIRRHTTFTLILPYPYLDVLDKDIPPPLPRFLQSPRCIRLVFNPFCLRGVAVTDLVHSLALSCNDPTTRYELVIHAGSKGEIRTAVEKAIFDHISVLPEEKRCILVFLDFEEYLAGDESKDVPKFLVSIWKQMMEQGSGLFWLTTEALPLPTLPSTT